jgi:hypothetical protein
MNYLDRNNIAAARIAGPDGKGLQDELGLTSTQYQVSIYSSRISLMGTQLKNR